MDTTRVDLAALAALRPGMPVAELRMIFGDDWVPPKPGSSFFFAEDIGFIARIDVRGIIGMVTFAAKFSSSLAIEKLKVGMTLQEARAAHPALRRIEDPEAAKYKLDRYVTALPNGTELEVRIREGRVLALHLSRPGLIYELPAPIYPTAEPTPGAPFADPNFKLVVLDALLAARAINLGPEASLAKHLIGPRYNREKDGYELLKPVYDYLVRYPLSREHLAAVEGLTFDGGNDIYVYPFPFWDGETLDFHVNSLAGIELLTNLRRFTVISMLNDNDLSRLGSLSKIEEVTLDPGPFKNARTLLALPKLREIDCYDTSLSDPAIEAALKAKGVKVTVYR